MTVRIITDSNGRKHITNEPLLHQPAPVQEPDHSDELTIAYMSGVHRGKELAAQRQWVGLTDEQVTRLCKTGAVYAPDGVVTRTPLQYREELEGVARTAVRKTEAKLKEKNT